MVETLILLAPLLVLAIVALFGFTGCGKPLPLDDDPVVPPGPPPPPPPPPPTPYAKVVEAEQGFVAHWGLDETTGTTALVTPPALNLNGQYLPGATPGSPGAFSLKEPGTNHAPTLTGGGYVEVPFSVLLNVDSGFRFSVELWARPLGPIPAGVEQILISSHHTAANQRGYEIALVGNGAGHATVRGRVFSTNAASPVTVVDFTPTQGDPVAWKHIVLTYDGSGGPLGKKLTLWVSITGAAVTNFKDATGDYSPVQNNQRPLRFGAGHLQAGGPEKFFAGLIDEVTFYNVVLPQATVEKHFKLF